MKITLIVPVCNPRAQLFPEAVALHQAGIVRVVFADDGTVRQASTVMLEKAEKLGCAVLSMPADAKQGNAAKRGLAYYLQNTQGHAGAITTGLNDVPTEQTLKELVRKMPRDGQALVLGVRACASLSQEEAQRVQRAKSLLADNGCYVDDPLSGVCLFSNALAQACVKLPQEGAAWWVNLLLAAAQNTISIRTLSLPEGGTQVACNTDASTAPKAEQREQTQEKEREKELERKRKQEREREITQVMEGVLQKARSMEELGNHADDNELLSAPDMQDTLSFAPLVFMEQMSQPESDDAMDMGLPLIFLDELDEFEQEDAIAVSAAAFSTSASETAFEEIPNQGRASELRYEKTYKTALTDLTEETCQMSIESGGPQGAKTAFASEDQGAVPNFSAPQKWYRKNKKNKQGK